MKHTLLLLALTASLSACGQWPDQSTALDARAAGLAAPDLLPQDELLAAPAPQAQAAGDTLAARAAALRAQAAGL